MNDLVAIMTRIQKDVIDAYDFDLGAQLIHQDLRVLRSSFENIAQMFSGAREAQSGHALSGLAGLKMGLTMIRQSFPDWSHHDLDLAQSGNRVFGRMTVRGTHEGVFFGIEATGRTISFEEWCIAEFHDGKLAAFTGIADELGFLKQLGALPTG
ncbi:MAG: ester cyclase [Sphingomonadaceae bacterium]|nr:ester cyclase [Sphingomonadaceae bacterium]